MIGLIFLYISLFLFHVIILFSPMLKQVVETPNKISLYMINNLQCMKALIDISWYNFSIKRQNQLIFEKKSKRNPMEKKSSFQQMVLPQLQKKKKEPRHWSYTFHKNQLRMD